MGAGPRGIVLRAGDKGLYLSRVHAAVVGGRLRAIVWELVCVRSRGIKLRTVPALRLDGLHNNLGLMKR